MLKRYHHVVAVLFRAQDLAIVSIGWLVAYGLRFHLPLIEVSKGVPSFRSYATLTPLIAAIWMSVFAAMRVYQSKRLLRRTAEAQQIIQAHAIAILIFVSLTYFISEYRYSRAVILYFAAVAGFGLVAARLSVRNLLRLLRRRGYNLRHVLILGSAPSAQILQQKFERFPEIGLKVRRQIEAAAVQDVHQILAENPVDMVVLCLSRSEWSDQERLLNQLKVETVAIQLVPDVHEYLALGCEVEEFDDLPIVRLNDSPLDGWGALAKRLTDFFVSAVALIVLSPLLVLIALAIKLTSRGPVFYSQERMGLDGRTFRMFKFRSMNLQAEDQSGAVWASPGDTRRTAVGAFLRKTSLDELPQFWNVLLGQMSLVGPRPERPVFVNQFKQQIPHYMLRHKVKAGITGWAQVNGWRGDTSLKERIACDLYYIRNWSYFLDLKILVLTLFKGFVHPNAY